MEEAKEEAALAQMQAQAMTAVLVEACKVSGSDACKGALEERRRFGLNQLASVKGHQLKALIRLEGAVTAGDEAAVGVLSKQLAAINARSAAEAKAEASFDFVPAGAAAAPLAQAVTGASPVSANAQMASVAAAAGAAAAAQAAALQQPQAQMAAMPPQVAAQMAAPMAAAQQAAPVSAAAVPPPPVVQMKELQATVAAGAQPSVAPVPANTTTNTTANTTLELAAPLQQLFNESAVLGKAGAVVSKAKQEWKTERQAWEAKWESRINALMKHEKEEQAHDQARALKEENDLRASKAKEKVEREKLSKLEQERAEDAKKLQAKEAQAQQAKAEVQRLQGKEQEQRAKWEARWKAEDAKNESTPARVVSSFGEPQAPAPAPAAATALEARREDTPKDFLATPEPAAAKSPDALDEAARSAEAAQATPAASPAAAAAPPSRSAEIVEVAETMRGAIKAFREAIAAGHPELDETFHAQHNALTALLRAFPPAGDGKAALDEMVQAEMQLAPATPRFDEQSAGSQEGMLYGLQKLEEAKTLARKAASVLEQQASDARAASPLQLQRGALESLDAAEQMKELEMQKEALELEAKESQLLKESSPGSQ